MLKERKLPYIIRPHLKNPGVSIAKKKFWASLSPEKKKELLNNKNRIEASRKTMLNFWANMTPEEKEVFCKKRAKIMKERFSKLTPEERSAKVKNANAVLNEKKKDPEWRKARKKILQKNLAKLNNKIIKDIPRINTYAGVITLSEMEELNS